MRKTLYPIFLALLAAVFYAINTPFSKLLLSDVPPTFLAGFLYLGAGVGVGVLYAFHWRKEPTSERLTRRDLPYTVGMILLDIAAPIFLMLGIQYGTASNASLLGNFEIVATTLLALLLFRETVSGRLWGAIALITLSSGILSFESAESFQFSVGSLFVLLATLCWGLENNCTRKLSEKSTYEIVVLKGFFSGGGSILIAVLTGEALPEARYIALAMLLGFVAYGLSIFLYIRAQRSLGAAKTSAYYAVAPFVGAFLSFALVREALTWVYLAALLIMALGTGLVVVDTLLQQHTHLHVHLLTHTHDGTTHTHLVLHAHAYGQFAALGGRRHHHTQQELEEALVHRHG